MRERIFHIINTEESSSIWSKLYNIFNIIIIILSLLPLVFKEQTPLLIRIDQVALVFFIIEYALHIWTADIKYQDRSKLMAFLSYPVSFYGIVDLLSIIPLLRFVSSPFRLFRLFRLFRSLRIFRVFKIFRYSSSIEVLINAIKRQKGPLQFIFWVAFMYLIISALIVFNIEPESFPSFMDALFWAAGALTSATYGDYYPSTPFGQVIAIISFLVGVRIIALPSSIITAGFLDELKEETNSDQAEWAEKVSENDLDSQD